MVECIEALGVRQGVLTLECIAVGFLSCSAASHAAQGYRICIPLARSAVAVIGEGG